MKTIQFILCLQLFIILTLSGCVKENDTLLFISGIKEVENVVKLEVPQGALSKQQEVSITIKSDGEYDDKFIETAYFYQAENKTNYSIVISLEERPLNDSILGQFKIPDEIIRNVPQEHDMEIFALIYADGGEEILDNFELIESEFDRKNGVITALLPHFVFTDKRNSEGHFEAVLTFASTAGVKEGSLKSDSECLAFGIICPTQTCKVTSDFSYARNHPVHGVVKVHWGVDLGVPVGSDILAVSDGKIERISVDIAGYGLNLILRHDNGAVTRYCHLSEVISKTGQAVTQGEVIALSGGAKGDPNAGTSTGPHLHFEYAPNGNISRSKKRIDPMPCIEISQIGAISIRDNGNDADDAFEAYLNDIFIGKTEIGASNTIALSGLRAGEKKLKVKCIVAPDNKGTLEIVLNEGILFNDGQDYYSAVIPENDSVVLDIVIPSEKGVRKPFEKMYKSNRLVEEI